MLFARTANLKFICKRHFFLCETNIEAFFDVSRRKSERKNEYGISKELPFEDREAGYSFDNFAADFDCSKSATNKHYWFLKTYSRTELFPFAIGISLGKNFIAVFPTKIKCLKYL